MPSLLPTLSALGLYGLLALAPPLPRSEAPPMATTQTPDSTLAMPTSHHGRWTGPNRLWVMDPNEPLRSDGTIECTAEGIDYTWSYEGKEQSGTIRLHGQPAALRIAFQDTFHSPKPMALHGHRTEGVVRSYGTYGAGPDQPEWGWILELDCRDPEALVLRMFNVVPGVGPVPAVVLHGAR